MPNRHGQDGDGYRYGFNGMESDGEVRGNNNSYDFGARMLDPRIGRWLSVDPQTSKAPSESPYDFVFNHPISHIDPDGEYPLIVITNEITGYTVTKVYSKNNAATTMLVPTYKMIVYDVADNGTKKTMGTYNVTRDGWYDIGEKGKPHYVNYTTEPKTKSDETNGAAENYTPGWTSPTKVIQVEQMWAKKRTTEISDDGEVVPVARDNSEIASGVQIHVGGIYEDKKGTTKVGGTYGCFGVVDKSQVYKNKKKLKALLKISRIILRFPKKWDLKKKIKTSNDEMNDVNKSVNDAIENAKKRGESDAGDTKVTIKSRENYEEEK